MVASFWCRRTGTATFVTPHHGPRSRRLRISHTQRLGQHTTALRLQLCRQNQRRIFRAQIKAATDLLPREKVLKSLESAQVADDVAARLVELASRAVKNFQVVTTDFFLRPNEFFGTKRVLSSLAFVGMTGSGGYATAERQLAAFFPKEFALTVEQEQQVAVSNCDSQLRVLEFSGNFLFDRASHSDFLGAVLGSAGLRRERLGDIIVLGDRGAQLIALQNDIQTIQESVVTVRSTPVQIRVLDSLAELEVRPPRSKTMTSVEASLRLDAVASAGFGMSRSKMAEIISAGDVSINWVPSKSAAKSVAEGDTITLRGRGRLEVVAIATTAKGRYRIEMKRFT
ncbi:hypothetical protein F1559_001878 [Cyanidiococcus yangmingshanensis]|uniref:RNA-binding S4 domain-containing protein n=1 Tax=Cyanidiococcus yangmingshanensis TaxID=2690220 RepID=A0A7J7IHC7_9RHOD|nr:hypothetical protein F1559_001878 [Cyanidiococcus yangmingshanensis]